MANFDKHGNPDAPVIVKDHGHLKIMVPFLKENICHNAIIPNNYTRQQIAAVLYNLATDIRNAG
jgi:hypothetical protein